VGGNLEPKVLVEENQCGTDNMCVERTQPR